MEELKEWKTVCRKKKNLADLSRRSCINPKSLQELIRARIKKNLNQEQSDVVCSFPCNTFKNIESNLIIPTEEQKCNIQQHFNVYLH